MDQEAKQLLEENLKLSKDNNTLLLKIYNIQRWAQIMRVVYWTILILASIGAFYYLKPLLGNLVNVYTGGISGMENITDITSKMSDKQGLQDLLNSFNE